MTILHAFSSAVCSRFDPTVKESTLRHVPCVTARPTMATAVAPRMAATRQLASGGDSIIEVIAASYRGPSPLPRPVRAPVWRVRGYSMIEVMVALSVLAILMRIAVPMWKANSLNVVTARRIVVANLRLARANAITKSIHYQVSFTTGSAKLSGMVQPTPPATAWTVDTTKVQTTTLPNSTSVSTSSVVVEFNTRGMVANSSTMTLISLTDSAGHTKSLQVWPSGQIHEM